MGTACQRSQHQSGVEPTDRQLAPLLPQDPDDPKVRDILGVHPGEFLILTVGGDAASKGGREVIEALATLGDDTVMSNNSIDAAHAASR
jgi:hypothetical protein